MAKTYHKIQKNDDLEASFELDLSPMLALMVCLIPIMLLSTVFVKVTVIDTPLPQVVQKAIEEDRKKKDREVEVSVAMEKDKELMLTVTVDGRATVKKKIIASGTNWNFAQLNADLIAVKQEHPKVFRLNLNPSEEVPYDDIVKIMDEVRTVKDEKVKLFVTDEETKEQVETNIMFPDVVFGNVLEG